MNVPFLTFLFILISDEDKPKFANAFSIVPISTGSRRMLPMTQQQKYQYQARSIRRSKRRTIASGNDVARYFIAADLDEGEIRIENQSIQERRKRHNVEGIDCIEITLEIDVVGNVTILEATAKSQEHLVDMAIEGHDEENEHNMKPTTTLYNSDPYGTVLWPAASAVANHLLKTSSKANNRKESSLSPPRPELPLDGMTILELGAGTGLVSIAALLGGADKVIATDYEDIPLKLLKYAINLNTNDTTISNDDGHSITTAKQVITRRLDTTNLDLCKYDTQPIPFINEVDVVVAADVMYEPKTGRALARRVVEALKNKCRVIVGDSPGRAGRQPFLDELQKLGIPSSQAKFTDTIGYTVAVDSSSDGDDNGDYSSISEPRHELICGKESKSTSVGKPNELPIAILDLDPNII